MYVPKMIKELKVKRNPCAIGLSVSKKLFSVDQVGRQRM